MNDRIRQILSWYESDNPGVKANLYRMLCRGTLAGTGRMVILPVDQGFEHGPARSFAPNPPGYDPHYHFKLALEAGCNAYAAPLGFLEAGASTFAGQVPLILKLNSHETLLSDRDPISVQTGSVADALRLGCAAIGYTVYPGSALAGQMYEQIRDLAKQMPRFVEMMSGLAKSSGLYIVAGSIPVSREGSDTIYNDCFIFNPFYASAPIFGPA